MKKLYGQISINKQIIEKERNLRENINYYKLKNEKYGIEIVKENEEKEKIEIANVANVTDNEDAINYILNLLVTKQVMPTQEDVIDDLVKRNFKIKQKEELYSTLLSVLFSFELIFSYSLHLILYSKACVK